MDADEEGATSARRRRAHRLAEMDGITKEKFIERTGFSEDQWYYWYGSSKKRGAPNPDQIEVICAAFDWSPTFIFYGIGPQRLSEIEQGSEESSTTAHLVKVAERQEQILEKLEQIASSLDVVKFSREWGTSKEQESD